MARKLLHRIEGEREHQASLKNWGERPEAAGAALMPANASVDCGWGRLIFGQTFSSAADVAGVLADEQRGRRDVAFYVRDPHVILACAPQTLFLDPSHSYRLDLGEPIAEMETSVSVRRATDADESEINRLYRSRQMVPVSRGFCRKVESGSSVTVLVAEETATRDSGRLAGVVMGVDHRAAFNDPDNGSSLWALAVDPRGVQPGVGRALVMALARRFRGEGRRFMDLSVLHDNKQAIDLYEKFGFERIPVYSVKRKNPINEDLFIGPALEEKLNVYARIIVDEARRRGILVEIEDAEAGLFRLSLGGRSIACRESLSELTSAVAMSRCDDKALTRRLLKRAGLSVPDQISADDDGAVGKFLARHGRVVVKPARGEQGRGVYVDLSAAEDVSRAIGKARAYCEDVLVEQYMQGNDLRIIVIDGAVAAAAIRRPAAVRGDGAATIAELIERQSRRMAVATQGEGRIPMNEETERCVGAGGYGLGDVLPDGNVIQVQKTANLHTGGTIHDVTDVLHPFLATAAMEGAHALDIPVVGFDFIVADPSEPGYAVIEANERPGLANHEPQPTAERFVDLLFPQSRDPASNLGGGISR